MCKGSQRKCTLICHKNASLRSHNDGLQVLFLPLPTIAVYTGNSDGNFKRSCTVLLSICIKEYY